MSTIVTRSGKGSPLTHVEVDANFTNLNTDKYQEGSAIGAVTPAAGTFTTLTATGQTLTLSQAGTPAIIQSLGGTSTTGLDISTPVGAQARFINLGDGTRPLVINGGAAAGAQIPGISAPSTLALSAGGGNNVAFYTNGRVTTNQFTVSHTASAVNYVQVTGAATGGFPAISAQGSDTNVTLRYNGKGSGGHLFYDGNGAAQFRILPVASTANYLQVTSSIAGSAPILSSQGSDTNIDLTLTPKGTGNVRFGTYTANMALTVQGYIEIKDSGGTVRKLAVIA